MFDFILYCKSYKRCGAITTPNPLPDIAIKGRWMEYVGSTWLRQSSIYKYSIASTNGLQTWSSMFCRTLRLVALSEDAGDC